MTRAPAQRGVGLRLGAPGHVAGPSVTLPHVCRLTRDNGAVETIEIEAVTPRDAGSFTVNGRAAGFEAEATWRPDEGVLPRWDVELVVRYTADQPMHAGVIVPIWLAPAEDHGWLIPGAFYGENRPAESAARYPRFVPGRPTPGDPFASSTWNFRSDRAATPVVMAHDDDVAAALATTETTEVGLTGLGFEADVERAEIRLLFPYREEPLAYDGSPDPAPATADYHQWHTGDVVRIRFRCYVAGAEAGSSSILRDLHAWFASSAELAPWVDVTTAASLAAEGLLRWHYRPEHAALFETAAFERDATGSPRGPGDRAAMHVAWLSGAPAATALLVHGRRVGRGDAIEAGRTVLDAIASNLAPCGTFWGQWVLERGWTKGWTPGEDRLHARTLAEATLFMTRAAAEAAADDAAGAPSDEGVTARWRAAVESNVAFVSEHQRADGAIPSAWQARTGVVESWLGTAGLAWVPAFVEGARLLGRRDLRQAAGAAGHFYADAVQRGQLMGAPEDVDLGPTSEDGYVAVMAYVALAESEPEPDERSRWVELARMAADWLLTFRYSYNVTFEPTTLLGQYGFRSLGADQASPANQHLHSYGLVCLPEMVRLARLTGDRYYLDRTRENLACFRQFIARSDGDFNARRGMTPERFYHTACFGPKGAIGPLSHAWCLGLLLYACEAARDLPELGEGRGA